MEKRKQQNGEKEMRDENTILVFTAIQSVVVALILVLITIFFDVTDEIGNTFVSVIFCAVSVPASLATLFLLGRIKWNQFFFKKTNIAKEVALSITYLRHLKRGNWKLKLALFICTGIFFGLSWKLPQINLSVLSIVLLGLISLLITKELLVEYRIRKGLFGTNRMEARALIKFIIKNSDDIDFTDSNGNLRRALLPEADPTPAEQPLPAFGEEAPA
ncbi:hypothetical protein GMJAKD_05940 [Candidatus Electrothrix aarhusensis]